MMSNSTPPKGFPAESLQSFTVDLLGRRIDFLTVSAIVESIYQTIIHDRKLLLAHYNVHGFNLSMQLPWFYDFLQSADIAHCDSLGILKSIRLMGLDLPIEYRASYTLLMPRLLAYCNWHEFSLFLLGGQPAILDQALEQLKVDYPNIRLSGHHGYFQAEDPEQNQAVVDQINREQPQILLVGMGMPRQENWIRLNRHRLNANVVMCGGAVIDRLAGMVPDCPPWISNVGLEWMYRLYREPRRLATRYLLGNPAFLLSMILAKSQGFLVTSWDVVDPIRRIREAEDSARMADEYAKIKRVGHYLISLGKLTHSEVETALIDHITSGLSLQDVMLKYGWSTAPLPETWGESVKETEQVA